MRDLPSYLMMTLGVLALSGIYLVHRRRQTVAPKPVLTTGGGPGFGGGDIGPREPSVDEPPPAGADGHEAHEATPAE